MPASSSVSLELQLAPLAADLGGAQCADEARGLAAQLVGAVLEREQLLGERAALELAGLLEPLDLLVEALERLLDRRSWAVATPSILSFARSRNDDVVCWSVSAESALNVSVKSLAARRCARTRSRRTSQTATAAEDHTEDEGCDQHRAAERSVCGRTEP